MSFKETVLPDFVLAELYPASLSAKRPDSESITSKGGGGGKKASAESMPGLTTAAEAAQDDSGQNMPVSQSRSLTGEQPKASDIGGNAPTTSVMGGNPSTTSATRGNQPYKYLGKNQKKVSVIARYSADPYIPEEHLQFLIKILSACKLNLGDVAILNDATAAVEIGKLKAELEPAFVLLFDVEPVTIGLPLSFPLLRPQSFDGTHYLTVPPIASLLEDSEKAKGLKKQLWDSLKKMFGV